MSDNQHTPGPWFADVFGIVRHGKPVGQFWCNPIKLPSAWKEDAWSGSALTPEIRANARLVAAAPYLLALARRNLEAWENALELGLIPERHRNTAEILAQENRAAIAKATGAA